ncbi:MAG: hypothetical protein PS018_13505 [bacterium]|nr:hypothetical protein [bacterium]
MPGNRHFRFLTVGAPVVIVWLLASPAAAQQLSREQDIVELRLGQRVLVDDGSCPAGQIKEVSGSQMTSSGVLRTRKCIPRLGAKKR